MHSLGCGIVFADAGYAGEKLRRARDKMGRWTLAIIRRADTAKGFEQLPRRWVVERTIAWLNRNRRLAKDFEATIESAQAWLFIASVKLLPSSNRQAARPRRRFMSQTQGMHPVEFDFARASLSA